MNTSESAIRDALAAKNLAEHVIGITVQDRAVYIAVDAAGADLKEAIEHEAAEAAQGCKVTVTLTHHRRHPSRVLPGVRHVIAVASGKGGVGKSTVAVNLALAFAQAGYAVGLLDADIYGPSVPAMLNLEGKPVADERKKIIPLEKYGLKVMSMGFMIGAEMPVVWRGLMVQSAIGQFLKDVAWDPLDLLVIDLPPGTGDAQLTLAQQAQVDGVVIVSTPQEVAMQDARRALRMFEKVGVPILGMVENMSYFVCPCCTERSEIFGHDLVRSEAQRMNVPFLGGIPLDPEIRRLSDAGTPAMIIDPQGRVSEHYRAIMAAVTASIGGMAAAGRE